MSDNPVQVVIAAFNSPDGAGEYMDALRQGKKEGLIGIIDAAVVVKNAGVAERRYESSRNRHLPEFQVVK